MHSLVRPLNRRTLRISTYMPRRRLHVRDVFLSYAREDNDLAERLANALTASGVTVWWDHKIESGERFPQIIELELAAAKFVVVLWSRASIGSEWVGNEARVG